MLMSTRAALLCMLFWNPWAPVPYCLSVEAGRQKLAAGGPYLHRSVCCPSSEKGSRLQLWKQLVHLGAAIPYHRWVPKQLPFAALFLEAGLRRSLTGGTGPLPMAPCASSSMQRGGGTASCLLSLSPDGILSRVSCQLLAQKRLVPGPPCPRGDTPSGMSGSTEHKNHLGVLRQKAQAGSGFRRCSPSPRPHPSGCLCAKRVLRRMSPAL